MISCLSIKQMHQFLDTIGHHLWDLTNGVLTIQATTGPVTWRLMEGGEMFCRIVV